MSKKLGIIITHHNESEHIISPLLTSINSQTGINFDDVEIIISNNCDDPQIEFDINRWENLKEHTKIVFPDIKNKLGYSRKYAVELLDSDWTIFLDCDDELYSKYTLFDILSVTASNADIYHCNEIHETIQEQSIVPIIEGRNYVFLHGKIFKTSILKTYHFNKDELSDHEDIYTCLYLNGKSVKEEVTDITIYSWKANPKSVTRINNKEHDFLGLPDLIRCYQFIFDDLRNEGVDLQNHKNDILEFIKWKYVSIKIRSLSSDTFELEGLLALFIDTFDPNLECLSLTNNVYNDEPYDCFVHRIVDTYRNHIYPEWTYDNLYTNYFKKWDIKIKQYREYIRLAHNAYTNYQYDNCIEYSKKALSLNENSGKAYMLMSMAENCLCKYEISIEHSQIAYNIINKNLTSEDFENIFSLGECWCYDQLALYAYYNQQYELAYNWGVIACSKNYTKDERVNNNLEYYKKALNLTGNCAWMTLLTDNGYINGEIALVKSLNNVKTVYPIYCLVTNDIAEENINVLKAMGVNVIVTEKYIPEAYKEYTDEHWKFANSLHCRGWHNALTKLKIFDLTQFDKIVYIDNDTLIYENIDELFKMPHLSAVNDVDGKGASFCSGLLVIQPNHTLYNSLIEFVNMFTDKAPTEDQLTIDDVKMYVSGMIHDQLVLQLYFKNWENETEKHIPAWYHAWVTHFCEDGSNESDMYRVKAMHFVDAKPWVVGKAYYNKMIEKGFPEYGRRCLEYADYIEKGIQELRDKGIESPYLNIPD